MVFKRVFETSLHRWRLPYLFDLLHMLVVRDLRLQYKRSVLGIMWSLLNPLVMLLVFNFLFKLVLSLNIPKYSAFAFSGLLVWNWFQMSLLQSAGAITNNRDLIRQPRFPAAILPGVTVTTHLIHFLLAFPVLALLLINGDAKPGMTLLALPLVMAIQFVLTLSFAYLFAAINVTFRDTQHLLSVILTVFFYLTPVFYDASAVPERYKLFYYFNPMAQLVEAYRAVLIHGTLPNWSLLIVTGLVSVGLLRFGYQVFKQVSYRFVEEL